LCCHPEGPVQPEEEKVQEDLINVYKYLMGGNEYEAGFSQACPVTGEEAMDANKKVWNSI